MNGLWLDLLWHFNRRMVLLIAVVPTLLWATGYDRFALAVFLLYAPYPVLAMVASPWLLRLLWRTRGFWRVRRGRIVLYYPPDRTDAPALLVAFYACANQLESLRRRFGFRLRGKLTVVLFPTGPEIGAIFRDPCSGRALPFANVILINQEEDPAELGRHELVHLYSARWDVDAPPLLEEGLATWLQGSWCGVPVEEHAWHVWSESDVPLKKLLKRSFFFDPANRYACYILAASFTGFLIRHYGWDRYRKVFKGARRRGTEYMLRKHLGRTLNELEGMWREELGPQSASASGARGRPGN